MDMNTIPSQQLAHAISEIRTSNAIVIVGAGTSFMSGMPLAGHLPPLIWQVLDRHEEPLRSVCAELGIGSGRAKAVIGDDPARIRAAFSHIAANSAVRREFQTSFAVLNQERTRTPSVAHTALARLIHSRVVTQVISLNWDTLLEAAFENRYGIQINAQGVKLWKPHGDCASPWADWVLPHEPGNIPADLVAGMNAFAIERPRSLVIVGYSERDEGRAVAAPMPTPRSAATTPDPGLAPPRLPPPRAAQRRRRARRRFRPRAASALPRAAVTAARRRRAPPECAWQQSAGG